MNTPKRSEPNLVPVWRVRERMAAAGFTSVSALHREIKKIDADSVNFAQFVTLIDQPPARLTLRTVTALAIALRCQIGDFLGVDPANFDERV